MLSEGTLKIPISSNPEHCRGANMGARLSDTKRKFDRRIKLLSIDICSQYDRYVPIIVSKPILRSDLIFVRKISPFIESAISSPIFHGPRFSHVLMNQRPSRQFFMVLDLASFVGLNFFLQND